MSISGKVTASTVAASLTTVVGGIVGPHVFPHGVPSDVKGLYLGVTTAAVTFVSGYLAKHHIDAAAVASDAVSLASDLGVPFSQLPQAVEDVAEAVGVPLPVDVPLPVVPAPVAPVTPSVPVAE
jgi:hypothetical protein